MLWPLQFPYPNIFFRNLCSLSAYFTLEPPSSPNSFNVNILKIKVHEYSNKKNWFGQLVGMPGGLHQPQFIKNLHNMWSEFSSINAVNLVNNLLQFQRSNFSWGITFLARPVHISLGDYADRCFFLNTVYTVLIGIGASHCLCWTSLSLTKIAATTCLVIAANSAG